MADLNEAELLPCPMCGSPGYFVSAADRVKCTSMVCNAMGGRFEIRSAAIAAWNRRTPDGPEAASRTDSDGLIERGLKLIAEHFAITDTQRYFGVRGWPNMRADHSETFSKCATEAASRIAELEADLIEARTLDKGFCDWLVERDLVSRGAEVDWGDIVTMLTEHEREIMSPASEKAADRIAELEALLDEAGKALVAADQFITNGIELGFIRMPDKDCADPAHDTPSLNKQALASIQARAVADRIDRKGEG